jgi:2-keto-4-pentenoate hydratase/2-oxohepta-3-ene-1,7-dioic acid hydratase in catechol pathway
MKLCSFLHQNAMGFGPTDGTVVWDVSDRAAGTGWQDLKHMLATATLPEIATASEQTQAINLSEIHFEQPIPNPEKILCVGLNYSDHAGETNIPTPDMPSIFVRFPSSQVGHLEQIVAPTVSDTFDYEGELAVVISRPVRNVSAENAMEYVAGYTIFGEHSVREWQFHSRQATPGKNFWHSGSIGPWITTSDEIPDPTKLRVVTRLNGTEMQNGGLEDLIFDIPYLISYISGFTELLPGDVISTGTPSGVGFARDPTVYLKSGDLVEVEIAPIGVLRNVVIAEQNVR